MREGNNVVEDEGRRLEHLTMEKKVKIGFQIGKYGWLKYGWADSAFGK
jgi:hypothetical protein